MSKTKKARVPRVETTSFNGIANKFDENIYGTSKGQLRHQLLVHYLQPYLLGEPLKVLDAGGGTGMMACEFAKNGHKVTLNDVSQDTLDIAYGRLASFHDTKVILGEINELDGAYDLVICHAVLEWLTKPFECIEKLVQLLKPGGVLSLSFFNHDAKEFNNLLYGNFKYVEEGMPSKNTVRLNPHNAQKPQLVIDKFESMEGVNILATAGIRCIHDYMFDKQHIDDNYQKLFEMECEYGAKAPFKWMGKYFYVQIQKRQELGAL